MKITVVTDKQGWRRVYVGRECVREGPGTRIDADVIGAIMKQHGATQVTSQTVDSFDFLEEAGGVALS